MKEKGTQQTKEGDQKLADGGTILIVFIRLDPGIGKISLCKALAKKLSIRFNSRFPQCQLIEVNAHSLLSKWFSENGKLVAKLFQKIQEMMKSKALLRPEKLLYPVQILQILFGL
ncbi:pachytene checkpoint protein 2 homolog [Arachis duranensis]|uniref:Pachytene checkpoint protein 2 homolog n=1 Tax=Arachis duranensis TaxID=130453 RepID=A0A9C6WP10_ARADU|nr:pachytene checkpoint protein 2 homolog [Arachis duranensis]